MNLEEVKKIFDKYSETSSYSPDNEFDIPILIDNYLFLIQTKNNYNNIILAVIDKPNISIRKAFTTFKLICKCLKINIIRIEGNTRRYKFLQKMFPSSSFIQEANKDRNIFYIKL